MKRLLTAVLFFAAAAYAQQYGSINGVTNQVFVLPVPTASALGGIQSITSASNNWISYIDTSGVPHQSQPAFSNLTGSATCAQLPALTGDTTSSAGTCATATTKLGGVSASLGGALSTGGTLTTSSTVGITGAFTTAAAFTTAGANALTLTTTGVTNATFPSGTVTLLGTGLNTYTRTQTMAVNTVASSATPTFDLSQGNVQYVSALATNITSMTFSNITTGGQWTFVICNNGTGNFTAAWPASVHGGMAIGLTASKCSSQNFTSPDGSTIFAQTAGIINQ